MNEDNIVRIYVSHLIYRLAPTRRPNRHIRPQFIGGSGFGVALATGFAPFMNTLRPTPLGPSS